MLLELTNWLAKFHSGFGVFQYLTLRAVLGVLTALVISLVVGPWMISRLTRLQIGQTVRNDGPQSHMSKAGTPTMGGALVLVAIATSTLFWADLNNRFVWVVLFVVGFSFVLLLVAGVVMAWGGGGGMCPCRERSNSSSASIPNKMGVSSFGTV